MPHETTAPYLTLGPLLRDPCLGPLKSTVDVSAAEVDADADELAEAQLENLFLHIRHGLPNGIVYADWLQQGTLDRDSACYLACGLHPVFWAHGGGLPAYAQPSLLLAQVELLRHRAQQAGREVDTPQGWLHWFQQLAPLLGGHFKLNRLFVDAVAQLSTGLGEHVLHGAVPELGAASATAQTLEPVKRVGRPRSRHKSVERVAVLMTTLQALDPQPWDMACMPGCKQDLIDLLTRIEARCTAGPRLFAAEADTMEKRLALAGYTWPGGRPCTDRKAYWDTVEALYLTDIPRQFASCFRPA